MGSAFASEELEAGHHLGKYEILRKLATGGMAEIYLARARGEAGFEKLVVIKRISPAVAADEAFVAMFLDEARLAATLRHANIGDVIDVGEEGGTYFFAMEYIAGQDTRMIRVEARRQHKPIPLGISLAIISGTASALAYAHERRGPHGPLGLVHRDVSPSNILVSYDGAIKLVDFGIARATSRKSKTQTGTLKGKIPYMSPEQCRGAALDGRSDLFSLGTVLYELTTGMRPFQGANDYHVMEAIVRADPPLPSATDPSYPRDLEAILMRLLDRNPDRRYQTAHELLEHLEGVAIAKQMFGSAMVITKYMHDLFADRIAGWDRTGTAQAKAPSLPGPITQTPMPSSAPTPFSGVPDLSLRTREYPHGTPPASLIAALAPAADFSGDEPTTGFKRSSSAMRPPAHTPATAQRTIARSVLDETTSASRANDFSAAADEETHNDYVLAFDPVAARSAEILGEVDVDADPRETRAARAARRIPGLFDQSWSWYELGELDKAVIALELALVEDPTGVASQKVIHRNRETMMIVFDAFLGDPAQVPVLARPLQELAHVALGAPAGFLLSRVDGELTMADLLDVSGMPRVDACRYLCQLILRGALVIGERGSVSG